MSNEKTNKTKMRAGLQNLINNTEIKRDPIDIILQNAFWYPIIGTVKKVTDSGVKNEEVLKDIGIDFLSFYDFLYNEGFRRFEFNDESIYIRIVNNKIVKRCKKISMMDAVFNFIDLLPETMTMQAQIIERRQLKSTLLRKMDLLFNDARLLSQLRPKEKIEFNSDEMHCKYMYFQNGYLQIDAQSMVFKTYDTLKNHIWEAQVFDHNYSSPAFNPQLDYVRRFCLNVSGRNEQRLKTLMNIIGYSIHNYTNYKLKSLAFTDSVIDDEGEANGRSGKTFLAKLIGGAICSNPNDQTIKTFVEINGKDFDPAYTHKYDACDINTQLIVLNDVRKWFDVECIYNDITEGINVNKKGMQPFKINAKMIVITNKTLKVEGESSKDRFIEFEFANHYSASHTPEMEFKHWFFRDWNTDDYNRYYWFMAECAQEFFKAGSKLLQPEQINLFNRKLIDLTNKDFIDFVENEWKPMPGIEYDKTEYYNKFVESYPDMKQNKKFLQRTFTQWLRYYCKYTDQFKDPSAENETRDSNGKRCFIFIKNNIKPQQNNDKTT